MPLSLADPIRMMGQHSGLHLSLLRESRHGSRDGLLGLRLLLLKAEKVVWQSLGLRGAIDHASSSRPAHGGGGARLLNEVLLLLCGQALLLQIDVFASMGMSGGSSTGGRSGPRLGHIGALPGLSELI
jgi:hypothetical protein